MNPELQRHIWLNSKPLYLVIFPIILGLILLSLFASRDYQLSELTYLIYIICTVIGFSGVGLINKSIAKELQNNTFDSQRLSALTPWQMTWGKFLGTTLVSWYSLLWLMVMVSILSIFTGSKVTDIVSLLSYLPYIILGCFIFQTTTLNVSLFVCQQQIMSQRTVKTANSNVLIVFIFIFILNFISPVGLLFLNSNAPSIMWFGMSFNPNYFSYCALILFSIISIIGAWRSMSTLLLYENLPWAWLGFLSFITIFILGFNIDTFIPLHSIVYIFIGIFYMLIFAEINYHFAFWHRITGYWQAKQYRRAIATLPLWTLTLLYIFLAIIVLNLYNPSNEGLLWGLLICLGISRDCLITQFISFNRTKNPGLSSFSILFLLHVILPALCKLMSMSAFKSNASYDWLIIISPYQYLLTTHNINTPLFKVSIYGYFYLAILAVEVLFLIFAMKHIWNNAKLKLVNA